MSYKNPRPLRLLAGRESEVFTDAIGERIGTTPIKRNIEIFPNGEIGVELQESVGGSEIYIVQTFIPGKINDGIIEFLLLADAAIRAGADRIYAVLRIYPYARQDRRERNKRNRHRRRPISARVIADLVSSKCDGVLAFDLHAEQIEGFFGNVHVENILPFKIFSDHLKELGIIKEAYASDAEKPVFVGPDVNSGNKTSDYAQAFNLSYAIIDKERVNGSETRVRSIIGDVSGHTCVIIDDIVASGSTLIKAKDALIKNGATKVIAMVTHFEGRTKETMEKLANAGFDKIVITDSVTAPEELKNYPVFEVLSLVPLATKVIEKVYTSESLQSVVYDVEA